MEQKTKRLYFVDAMRAWAILMMLQGHFIDGLLDNEFRNPDNLLFNVWQYFRGITAPVFFTVSGFIFTYLLTKTTAQGFDNPRVKKGIKRGFQLILIGYLLRMNLLGLLIGEIYKSFYLIDVLHCIGLSILGIISFYLISRKNYKTLFPLLLLGTTILLFLFEPAYVKANFTFLPDVFANYFSKANGSVFTIIPWFGYATFGAFLSLLFRKFANAKYLYTFAILISLTLGTLLIFFSSGIFLSIFRYTNIQLFADIFYNNYLFIRLGDVLIIFAVFMLVRQLATNATVLKIGGSTLSIYIIHFIILYGSFTGVGIYRFLNHSLSPLWVILGAILFMITCTYLALRYENNKEAIHLQVRKALNGIWQYLEPSLGFVVKTLKRNITKLLHLFGLVKN